MELGLEKVTPDLQFTGKRYPTITRNFVRDLVISSITKLYLYTGAETFNKLVLNNREYNRTGTSSIGELAQQIMDNLLFSTVEGTNPNSIVTPWTIEQHKERTRLTLLLGAVRTELPMTVVHNRENKYSHNMSEELAYGIIIGLEGDVIIKVYFTDSFNVDNRYAHNLTPVDLNNNFDKNIVGNKTYTATITTTWVNFGSDVRSNVRRVTFDTPVFIQGIITGATWNGQDPHKYINNIRRNRVLLDF